MSIKNQIKDFVIKENPTKYELCNNYKPNNTEDIKCLGVHILNGGLLMDFLADLTEYLDQLDVDDTNLELEGVSYDCVGDDVIVYFPAILDED